MTDRHQEWNRQGGMAQAVCRGQVTSHSITDDVLNKKITWSAVPENELAYTKFVGLAVFGPFKSLLHGVQT